MNKRLWIFILILAGSLSVVAQDSYYLEKANDYMKKYDKANTYSRWANEASDKARMQMRWANEAREKAQLRMRWAKDAMDKARQKR